MRTTISILHEPFDADFVPTDIALPEYDVYGIRLIGSDGKQLDLPDWLRQLIHDELVHSEDVLEQLKENSDA